MKSLITLAVAFAISAIGVTASAANHDFFVVGQEQVAPEPPGSAPETLPGPACAHDVQSFQLQSNAQFFTAPAVQTLLLPSTFVSAPGVRVQAFSHGTAVAIGGRQFFSTTPAAIFPGFRARRAARLQARATANATLAQAQVLQSAPLVVAPRLRASGCARCN